MKNTPESNAKELQCHEHHFTLDLAENMTVRNIFSTYHEIRKSGISERNVPHAVLPCVLLTIG